MGHHGTSHCFSFRAFFADTRPGGVCRRGRGGVWCVPALYGGRAYPSLALGGHLWTAKWWTEADKPGGAGVCTHTWAAPCLTLALSAGIWVDEGACY